MPGTDVDAGDGLTRRGMIGLSVALSGMVALPDLAQAAPERLTSIGLTFAYEAIVTLGKTEEVGATPLGKRIRIPITGGRFAGPRIAGTILPEGMDWQLVRDDGTTVLEASYLMRERDGTLIHITNRGLVRGNYIRTTPVFEVPLGKHQWLNESIFLGTVGAADPADGAAVRITVYQVA
ncbi:DUF3237 domain-containing protein [Sphingomonas sanguinis]|uniref:DUF3237 domain-containing protein n=1 Tax=Sphingomonas sp. LC-1 TaxID=3110957 RepID=UPI0021BB0B14|nr:DUF3237 domain-containing protein [Sphingomonas sp. LC-1]MCT8003951.1 DUF3237 domain-containing protein [Sphingomonas sp. LC-1]